MRGEDSMLSWLLISSSLHPGSLLGPERPMLGTEGPCKSRQVPCGVFGPSWGAPGGFVAAPGARRGCFWALLGRSRRPFGYPWRASRRFWTPKRGGARDIVKHTVLRCFCVVLGPPGPLRGCQNGSGTAHVGPSKGTQGPCWGTQGPSRVHKAVL